MENIREKFGYIYNRKDKRHGEIFIQRRYKNDLEWLTLGYMTRLLKLNNEIYPVYAKKTNPPEPDFLTYGNDNQLFKPIEITEVLRPGRKRSKEYKKNLQPDRSIIDTDKWTSQVTKQFRDKFRMCYNSNTWLVIYFNIPYGHIANYGWWHLTMEHFVNEWFYSDIEQYQDFKFPPYERILMISCDGGAMIQLYPFYDVIVEWEYKELLSEHNLDKW